jgi:hypothetical protein
MVDLLEADPSLGVEGAAALAVRGMPGKLSTHVERLRKKHRRKQRAGQLPKAGRAGQLERREKELRQFLTTRKEHIYDAKRLVTETEREVATLGLDPDIDTDDIFEQIFSARQK